MTTKAVQKLALLFMVVLLSACASAPQTQQLLTAPGNLPPQAEISNTPFFPQEKYQCGPAALATVLKHSGVNVNAEALVDEVYLPSRLGSLQVEILASTRRHTRLPYRITPNMYALLREIAAGNPVLVLQNLGLSWTPQWHYAVVVGFDLHRQEIVLRSGINKRHISNMHTFELTWARSQHWGIVVMAADKLPTTATLKQTLRTIVALEAVAFKNSTNSKQQWRTIHRAYDSTLTRWPSSLVAQMGLGNSAYQLGKLDVAAKDFRAALRSHPDASAAHNNLAQVLMELALKNQGALDEAEKHARRAVELGGPHLKSYQETLDNIRQAPQQ